VQEAPIINSSKRAKRSLPGVRNVRVRTLGTISLFLLDVAGILAAFGLAYVMRRIVPIPNKLEVDIPFSRYHQMLVTHVICLLLIFTINKQYYIARAPSRIGQLYGVIINVTIGTLMTIAVATFLFKGEVFIIDFPRMMLAWVWLMTILLLIIGRTLHYYTRNLLRRRGIGRDRLLIVGTGDVAKLTLQRILWSPQLGYEVVGIVDPHKAISKLLGTPILGGTEDLPRLIEQYDVDEVIIAIPEQGHRAAVKVVNYCQRGLVSIKIFPDVFQFITEQATIDDLGGLPLLTVRDFAMQGYMLVFKRLLDIVGSLAGLIILSPILLMTAIAVKIESKGSAFFIQERMGLDRRPIKMVKFRSMRADAENDGPGWTVEDDPRRTRIGAWLRKVNLDEIPQLINVLLGEMSLVGPRPEQVHYVNQFRKTIPNYMRRHQFPAGMTGWAQVNGLRGDTSIVERTKYDLWYIENWSLGLDLTILVRTVWQTITGQSKGAG
jgi:exopolysaccharide biosynthesis polyprenyl glycosylphosphotransferase